MRQEDERIDYDQLAALAREHKPKMITVGASAYPRTIDFERMGQIARPGRPDHQGPRAKPGPQDLRARSVLRARLDRQGHKVSLARRGRQVRKGHRASQGI